MEEYFVYKYVADNKIVYIGKADHSLERRIAEHSREDRFKEYPSAEIYCMPLQNPGETSCMEFLLINRYKPVLNTKDKYPESLSIDFTEPDWIPYSQYLTRVHPAILKREKHPGMIEQEIFFWKEVYLFVMEDFSGKNFTIKKSCIPDIAPLSFVYKETAYNIFTFHFCIGDMEMFIFSAAGRLTARNMLKTWLTDNILRGKEGANNEICIT